MQVPFVLELRVSIACRDELRTALRRELELRKRASDVELKWNSVECEPGGRSVIVVCEARGDGYAAVKEAVLGAVSTAVRAASGQPDVTAVVRNAGVLVAPRPAVLSRVDRWGWYAVTVTVRGAILHDDPEVGEYVKAELPKWQRFRSSSVEWSARSDTATVQVLTFARSPNAAFGEAADAVENLLWAATKDPGDYTVEPDRVEWVAPDTSERR